MGQLPARLMLAAASFAVALIFGAIAMWFLAQALFMALVAAALSPALAALLVGAGGMLLAALIGLLPREGLRSYAARAHSPEPLANGGAVNSAAAEFGALAARYMANSAQAHPYETMGAALAAGLALGAFPELRKVLADLFKH